MHENPDLQEQDTVQSTPQEQEIGEADRPEIGHPSLVSMLITDEGLEEAGTLLKAWVPDIPLSIIVVTSKDSHVAYLTAHLESLKTFTLSVLSEPTDIAPGHIYVLPPDKTFKFQEFSITVHEETQTEQFPGEAFLTTYGRIHRRKALLLLFAQSIADYAGTIKLLSNYYTSIIHYSRANKTSIPALEIPASHLVDRSYSLEEVAVYTQRFIESFTLNITAELEKNPQGTALAQDIVRILGDKTSTSFAYINPGYILLHVYQRLRLKGFTSIEQYVELLATNQEEVTCLAKRISLKNTSFFNDLRSLRVIAKTMIPPLAKEADPAQVIRVWIPGCSSGEDVLSLSMLIHEHADSVQTSTKVRLLGTENNESVLQFARQPQYSATGLSTVPNILKDKFFVLKDGVYEYDPAYLEQCHYTPLHPTMKGPYADIDIIYCKEVLPTLTRKAQRALLQQFNEALSPQGVLVLGSNETSTSELPFFSPLKNQPFIFKPIQTSAKEASEDNPPSQAEGTEAGPDLVGKEKDNQKESLAQSEPANSQEPAGIHTLHRDLLLQIQASVSLMIRPDFTIVDHIGNVGRFIAWPNNGHTTNMLEAFPKEVQEDLRFAVNQVIKSKVALKSRPIRTEYDGIFREFRLQVHPINLDDAENNLIQVIFLETDSSIAKQTPVPPPIDEKQQAELSDLKSELSKTQEKLKIVTGLLQDSKELLKNAKVREKQAIESASKRDYPEEHTKVVRQNEELRSTNTELLELNRDLVRRIEELRRSMNRKLKEVEQAKMSQAQTPDDTSNEEKGLLNKNLTLLLRKRHEVRTSLTSIIGFSDLLADRIVDKDNRELAKYIGKSGHRLSENLSPLLSIEFQDEEEQEMAPQNQQVQEDIVSSDRVLVVEDSEATRRLLTLVLSDRFECEVAADGSEAIKKAEKEIFKAVLLDIDLGKGPNGIDVLDHLRQKNYYRTVPFMAVTSMATPQDRSMLLRKGFDAFVPKPFQKVQLLSTLDKIIDNSGMIA